MRTKVIQVEEGSSQDIIIDQYGNRWRKPNEKLFIARIRRRDCGDQVFLRLSVYRIRKVVEENVVDGRQVFTLYVERIGSGLACSSSFSEEVLDGMVKEAVKAIRRCVR